jgi:hypothetical protein
MCGVAILAITLVPALIPLLIRGHIKGEEDNWIVRSFIHIYRPVLSWMIDRIGVVLWIMAAILLLASGFLSIAWLTRSLVAIAIIALALVTRRRSPSPSSPSSASGWLPIPASKSWAANSCPSSTKAASWTCLSPPRASP